jgi:hypothetical protein
MQEQFVESFKLFNIIRNSNSFLKKGFSFKLNEGVELSFLELLAPYLVLYRFPHLFENLDRLSFLERIENVLWPYRGLGLRLKDIMSMTPHLSSKGCVDWTNDSSVVLFLGFTPAFYQEVLKPVAEWLAKRKDLKIVVLSYDNKFIKDNIGLKDNIIFQSIWSHWSDGVRLLSKNMMKQLIKNKAFLFSNYNSITEDLRVVSNRPAFKRELSYLFWCEFKRLIPQVAVAQHIISEHKPRLIVSADDADQRCRIYSLLGKSYNIRSLLIQQGLTARHYPEWHFLSADVVASMGELSRVDMIKQNVSSETVVVTGHPGFDKLVDVKYKSRVNLRSELGVLSHQRMLLFASQPYYAGAFSSPEIRIMMIRAIISAISSNSNVKLIIKPHPSDNVKELESIIRKSRNVILVNRKYDVSSLIIECDLVITFFSTVALQALYAGKPVLNVAFPGSYNSTLFIESGATWVSRSTHEIKELIELLTGENKKQIIEKRRAARGKFIYDYAYLSDGLATTRIGKMILDMVIGKEEQGH